MINHYPTLCRKVADGAGVLGYSIHILKGGDGTRCVAQGGIEVKRNIRQCILDDQWPRRLWLAVDDEGIVAYTAASIATIFIGYRTDVGKAACIDQEILPKCRERQMEFVAVLMSRSPWPDIKKCPLRIYLKTGSHHKLTGPRKKASSLAGLSTRLPIAGNEFPIRFLILFGS